MHRGRTRGVWRRGAHTARVLAEVETVELRWRTRGHEGRPCGRQPEVGEDLGDDRRVLDGGEEAQAPAAAGARQDIDGEHAPHQVGPRPGAARTRGGRDAAVDETREPVLCERRAEQIADQALEPRAIVGADGAIGVEIEALQVGVTAPDGPDPRRIGLTADPQNGRAGPLPEGRAPADGAPR